MHFSAPACPFPNVILTNCAEDPVHNGPTQSATRIKIVESLSHQKVHFRTLTLTNVMHT